MYGGVLAHHVQSEVTLEEGSQVGYIDAQSNFVPIGISRQIIDR